MKTFLVLFAVLFLAANASAATLKVEVTRNGFTGPVDVVLAPRIEGTPPEWSAPRPLAAGASAVSFDGLSAGLYVVLVRGPQPLERLSAKVNLGASGAEIRVLIPKSRTALRVTLGGQPLARATVSFTHDELRWLTELETGADGRFEGALWEPGLYTARVQRDGATAPHVVDVTLATTPFAIDVPDRLVTGRVLAEDGRPVGGATVSLRTESARSTLTVRTASAPDGRFEFLGVRDGAQSLSARAPSYLNSDPAAFELHGAPARHAADLTLTRGAPRVVRVVDGSGRPIVNASLLTACDGHVKATTVTNAEGRANVALPRSGSCLVYALPNEGSIAMIRAEGEQPLVIPVPTGASSLHLALKSDAGEVFSGLSLLMRVDGTVLSPAIGRMLASRGLSLVTDEQGSISLPHIPPGTYEFWPYRTEAEGQTIYEVASAIAAPITIQVLTGENDATVRLKAHR
jgi:hypothetical protein